MEKILEDVELREKPSSSIRSQIVRKSDIKSIRNLNELVKCEMCNQSLNKPRMLPCQHTFCLSCLQLNYDEKSVNGNWYCPICERKYQFDNRDAFIRMPTNVYLESIFDLLNESLNNVTYSKKLSIDIRCIKCETLCDNQEQLCQHCKQIFCKVCWSEHVNDLFKNLSLLDKQLNESEIRLKYRSNDMLERCEKLKTSVEEAIQDKIDQLNAKKIDLLREIQNIKEKNQNLSQDLRQNIVKLKGELAKLNRNSLQNESQMIASYLQLHQNTSTLLEDVSKWGEFKSTLDRDALKIDMNSDDVLKNKTNTGITIKKINSFNEKDKNNAVIMHYRTYGFETKLYWNKCPRPAGIGIAPWDKNLLYIATTDNKVVLVFDMEKTKVIDRLAKDLMSCPYGITFNSNRKEIYVTDKWHHCIHVFQHIGNYLRTLCNDKRILRSPEGIAMANDKLFVCDTGNDRVIVINPLNGELISIYGQIGIRTELNLPTGIAIRDNNIYIADSGNHRIKVFNLNGEKLLEIGAKGHGKGQLKSPEVVAIDSFGCILVGDSGNSRLQIFKPDGNLIRTIGEYGNTPGKFLWISGVVVTNSNDIIVTDSKNKSLQIF